MRMKLERLQVCPASARQGSWRTGILPCLLAGRAFLDRPVDLEPGSLPGRAVDLDRPTQRLDPVGEADEPGASPRLGATDAVVADRPVEEAAGRLGDAPSPLLLVGVVPHQPLQVGGLLGKAFWARRHGSRNRSWWVMTYARWAVSTSTTSRSSTLATKAAPISNASRPLAISMRPVSPPRCSDVRSVLTAAGWSIIRSMVGNGLRVVLAEDDLLLREGLASLLERSGFQVVGQAGDATTLLTLVDAQVPELVVVDIRMPPSHTAEGLDAARQIRHHHPGIGILVLSAHVEVEHAMELLASGRGVGYLLKSRITDLEEFLDTLARIAKGGSVVDPALVAELVAARRRDDPLAGLSAREREVLGLMAEGRSNAGIARRLWVTEGTVEKHVRSILTKLGLAETDDDHRRVLAVLTYLNAR